MGQVPTEFLFAEDSYLRSFTTAVAEIDGGSVALEATAFYPGGGGQPHDTGTLRAAERTWTVTGARRAGEVVWHDLGDELPAVGTTVEGAIDWDRRYALMRTHSALHVLCGVVWRDYRAKVTGGNMHPLGGRMDFEFEQMRGELVREIEAKVNEEVKGAREVRVSWLDRAAADVDPDLIRTKINLLPADITRVRVVEIEGLDIQADGGTHVARTDEIGIVRITGYKSKGRINKRLEIALD